MIYQLGPILFVAALSLVFGIVILYAVSKVGPKIKASKTKLAAYESGTFGEKTSTTKVPVKFYLTAILFIIFDIEIVFLYPWATVYKDFITEGYGTLIFVSMFVFLAILLWGLFYEIKSKSLDWE